MTPDYDRAATLAAETLIKYGVNKAPVDPVRIFKSAENYNLLTFTEMSMRIGMERNELVSAFEAENHDAVTSVYMKGNAPHYLVAYNMRLPQYLIQRALAREIGHIVLGHDGTRPEEVRTAEAICFAHHLLCPRALIRAIQESGARITVEVLGNTTGCYERCLIGMRKIPATHVAPELNRQVHSLFSAYISDFLDFQKYLSKGDESMIANFGTYMDGYEE